MKEADHGECKTTVTTNQTFEIELQVKNELIGGFLLETEGALVDCKYIKRSERYSETIYELKFLSI